MLATNVCHVSVILAGVHVNVLWVCSESDTCIHKGIGRFVCSMRSMRSMRGGIIFCLIHVG